ncbi:MAG: endonuclease/exonuclease/phosphatase family protein [Polyangiaceae bacterium]|nr:endonuclease/exonuclease/phosphatase family protein [Polyangiaceae bacterium]
MRGFVCLIALALLAGACRDRTGTPERPPGPPVAAPSAPPPAASSPAPKAGPRVTGGSPWSSPEACLGAVRAGERLARPRGVVRVGTWNIRWFPDGGPGRPRAERGTDLEWLACALAWMDVDALSVQEVKTAPHAREAVARVLARAAQLGGGSYRAEFDTCPNVLGQHVGIVYRSDRLRAAAPLVLGELNPHGEPCKDQLRPGLALYLSRMGGGLDFSLLSVHFKSGTNHRDVTLRARSVESVDAALRTLARAHSDPDVVIAGDFNTMGCERCSPPISAADELASFDRALPQGLRRVKPDRSCTHAYGARSGVLDHVVVRLSASEKPKGPARVEGVCSVADCRFGQPTRAAREQLSDHCPVLVDLMDVDED